MKFTLLILALTSLILCSNKHKHRSDPMFHMNPAQEKHRQGIFGQVNNSPEIMTMLKQKGLTANYTQMLQNQKNYFVSKGIPADKVNLKERIVIGHKPKQTNLGYTYGELNKADDEYKKMKEAFTSDFGEMLQNPDKKVLILGIHPELATQDTREIKGEMEDPIIRLSPEEQEAQQKSYQERLDKKSLEIQEYLDTLFEKMTVHGEKVSYNQIKICNEIKDYLQQGDQKDQTPVIKNFFITIQKILTIFKAQDDCVNVEEEERIKKQMEEDEEKEKIRQENEKQEQLKKMAEIKQAAKEAKIEEDNKKAAKAAEEKKKEDEKKQEEKKKKEDAKKPEAKKDAKKSRLQKQQSGFEQLLQGMKALLSKQLPQQIKQQRYRKLDEKEDIKEQSQIQSLLKDEKQLKYKLQVTQDMLADKLRKQKKKLRRI